jgi:hypothetical protein
LEPRLTFNTAHDFDNEALEFGLVHELASVIGAIRKQMLEQRPALAHRMQNELGTGTVGRRQVDYGEASVSINRDMTAIRAKTANSSSKTYYLPVKK